MVAKNIGITKSDKWRTKFVIKKFVIPKNKNNLLLPLDKGLKFLIFNLNMTKKLH